MDCKHWRYCKEEDGPLPIDILLGSFWSMAIVLEILFLTGGSIFTTSLDVGVHFSSFRECPMKSQATASCYSWRALLKYISLMAMSRIYPPEEEVCVTRVCV